MPKNIVLVPDDNGQIRLMCDGEEIVITVGAPSTAATKPPSSNPPTQASRSFPENPFEGWKHNTQIIQSVPDGDYSFHTLGSQDELLRTLHRIGTRADADTTHVVRVFHRGTLDFQHIAELNKRSLPNVHVIFSRSRE